MINADLNWSQLLIIKTRYSFAFRDKAPRYRGDFDFIATNFVV